MLPHLGDIGDVVDFCGKGKRLDLTGCGLLRSQGGWAAVKALRRSGAYQKGDERILGDGDFVEGVLSQAEEQFQQKYRMKAKGYDLEKAIHRVAEIMGRWPVPQSAQSIHPVGCLPQAL